VFLFDVVCSYNKSEKPAIMDRCLKCKHYFRFVKEMEEEEEEFWDEVDRIRKYGYPRKFDVPKEGS